jgi:hypothetical protein
MAAAVDVPRAGHHHSYCGPMMGRKPLIVYGRSSYGQHRCCVTAHDLLRELDRVVSGGGLLLAMCHHKTWPWEGAESDRVSELMCLHMPHVVLQPAISEMPGQVAHCWLHEFLSTVWLTLS